MDCTFDARRVTDDERLRAALSHLSTLAMPVGLVVPAFLFLQEKGKRDAGEEHSPFVLFHAAQALAYQLVASVVLFSLLVVTILTMVLLPEPFLPRMATRSPGSIVNDTS